MFKSIVAISIIATTAAFRLPSMARTSSRVQMSAENLYGALPPVGFFDPLGLSTGKTDAEIKKFRESELKHGRIAMLAFVGILVGESFNPLFDGKITGPAIYQFQQADDLVPYFWVAVLFVTALIEGQNILTGWESAEDTNKRATGVAQLKENYINGDLGFDPLGLKPSDPVAFEALQTKEIQNGRLALLGVAGIVAQELVFI
jgi:light-harvesting complex I chlorophyll a/b binding protein 1